MGLRQRLITERLSLPHLVLRWCLRSLSLPYAAAMWLRNRAYDLGWLKSKRIDSPTICVGNLSVGGAGKTPMVAWLCRWLREQGWRVAIVSRGYGQLESGSNDEALELELQLPDVPHLQNPDRYAAALLAQDELEMQVVVLDDGFQHRRLGRDLDIVLLDASEPSAADWPLPGGLMREPWSGLARAAVVVLTRTQLASPERLAQLRDRVARFAPSALCVASAHAAEGWHGIACPVLSLADLAGKRVLAFAGIGNSAAFFKTLEQLSIEVVERRSFADHHAYAAQDVAGLEAWSATHRDCAAIVCTMKDWVKLQVPRLGGLPLVALRIGVTFSAEDEAALKQRIGAVVPLEC